MVIVLASCVCILLRLVSYEFVHESTNRREWMKVIISSQYLYFFQESPPDPSTLHNRINLDDLAECRAALGKTSRAVRRERERERERTFFFPLVTTGIPSVYIVLSLIDKQEQYTAPKYRCTNEQKARKVNKLRLPLKNLKLMGCGDNYCVIKL